MELLARLENEESLDSINHYHLVRSQLYVQGICCASECPSIHKILKPLPGVRKVQINITTKMVYVHHDPKSMTIHEIARHLHGFQARVVKDGAVRKHTASVGRTTLHATQVLTLKDIPTIQQRLLPIKGVKRVGINVAESVIYIEHDVSVISARHLSVKLENTCPNTVATDAQEEIIQRAATAMSVAPSKYVASTLSISNLSLSHIRLLEKTLHQNYIRAQLRAFYPHVPSKTLKLEHDPRLLQVDSVVTLLGRVGLQATVICDGAVEHLALPLLEDYDAPAYSNMDQDSMQPYLHINVILSGFFWFLSILSYIGGNWIYLEYCGIVSVLFGLPPVVGKAWRTLKRCQFDANCMMVTAALGALALQEYDEAASVAFLFAVSEYMEARATARARKALGAICNLRPEHANVIHPVTKEIVIVPAEKVPVGSLISVRTGDKIAADGVIVEGTSQVDESSLTGEAVPTTKGPDDIVSGGSINIGESQLIVKTMSTVEDSAVSRLIRLVEEAQANRSPTEKLVDSFAKLYTPVVVLMAGLMCTVPWFWGREVGRYWTLNGLIIIVIACPCALTISTPVTYAAGLAACAQRGIIVKGGARLEALGNVERVIFDKTGTLTNGQFSVSHLENIGTNYSRKEMLELLALMEAPSSHPLSATLVIAARKEGVSVPREAEVTRHSILKGEGVEAIIDDKKVYVGNKRLFKRIGMYESLPQKYKDLAEDWNQEGGTVGFIGVGGTGIVGSFCVSDMVRPEAKDVVRSLKQVGIEVMMLTGDGDGAARAVAEKVGIPDNDVHCQLLPEDKLHFVGSMVEPTPTRCAVCRPRALVLMCGDGVNDAPALAVADVGVSMGEGAALAMEMSDVTLMDSNLRKLLYSIKMGIKVLLTIRENIVLSLLAKLIVVGLTFAGYMTLLIAIAADVGIMLLVTLNGMKLLPGLKDERVQLRSMTVKSSKHYSEVPKPSDVPHVEGVIQSVKTVAEFV
jgi:Cd2+/Zn2+-exporting ATPase